MTRNNQFYKDLSFKYFRGEITASEEKELFEWLKSGENRMATLHEWEDEWKDTGVVENAPVWESMLGRIAAREALETSDVMPRRKMSPWIGAVAAAVVALFGAIFLLARPEPVQEYAMEAPAGEKSRIFLPASFWARKENRRMAQSTAVFFMKKTEAAAARIMARQKILRMR